MRKAPFVKGEYYHIFNRGTDKRNIFSNKYDVYRFIQSLKEFNSVDPIGSIYSNNKNKNIYDKNKIDKDDRKLVNIICYCLNPNHYHLILEQLVEGGISEFMKRLGGGYTQAFNSKYKRSGVLFQGKFKSVYIKSNEQLIYTSFYVNLNNKVHKKFDGTKKHFIDLIPNRSSWSEYTKRDYKYNLCNKDIVLGQFKSSEGYKREAEDVIKGIKEKRYED